MVALQTLSKNLSEEALRLGVEDVLVFLGLEMLGTLAIIGNLCLILVLLKNKYLQRASFILMLSLAIADVVHGFVTTCFFYPPIILKYNYVPDVGVRAFNVFDWTAWSISLTHMSGICLDRLIAIMLYGRYNLIVTVKRVRCFTIFCWTTFTSINVLYILMRVCCLITPLRNNHFYTFGYGEFEDENAKQASIFGPTNLFTFTYSPLELTTIAILSISNPITLVQLYRRHKRKVALRIQHPPRPTQQQSVSVKARTQWQRASTMLLEMSMRMGSKHLNNDVRELASRRASRQQQRILLQISVVAVIFYLYMSTYYMVYHVFEITNKWVVLFNSFFYSTTHMINPVIYFSLNKEMRNQLANVVNEILTKVCRVKPNDDDAIRKNSSGQRSSNTKGGENSVTETSPLCASSHNNTGSCAPMSMVERLKRQEINKQIQHNNSVASTTSHTNGFVKATRKESGTPVEERKISLEEAQPLISSKEPRRSLLESILQAMKRMAALERMTNRTENGPITLAMPSQSRSMDVIGDFHETKFVMKSSTVHGLSDIENYSQIETTIKESLVTLLDQNTVINSHQNGDSDHVEDDIIFL
uniref:G_PROTEIN_RECEP_F1_2 domain-containing protein n=1 Tax=Bursaphelenchus xylophilus TaxID=6326 RepID=A0A1I7SU88_BURXY